MKNINKLFLSICLFTTLLIGVFTFLFLPLTPVHAASLPSSWQKGASLYPDNGSEDFTSTSFQQSIKNLRKTGANYVALIIPLYQDSPYANTVHAGQNTPTDFALQQGIAFIHTQGMQVMFKPHVDTNGAWRANIIPGNKNTWFASYGSILQHYALLAQTNKVEEMSIGAELISLSTYTSDPNNTGYWNDLISSVRSIYSGKLTYSANWGGGYFGNEKDHIAFWDKLDYIGISAYFELTQTPDASVTQLENGWSSYLSQIQNLHTMYAKPVLFTEIGYRSVSGANEQPWNYTNFSANPDQLEQANDYTALFDYWSNYSWMSGVMLWNWSENPNAGIGRDFSYVPQNKSAQNVLTTWFNGDTGGVNPTPTITQPLQNSAFLFMSNTIDPSSKNVGVAKTISTTITNSGGNVNALIDLEVYDTNNTKVFQQSFPNQNFTTNNPNVFSIHWTPQVPGAYHLAGGVFSNDWSKNYTWNANLITFTINAATPPSPTQTPLPSQTPVPTQTPPQNSSVAVWWPASGAAISGVQPFKAVVNSASLGSYSMFWQVDGGVLNSMGNNADHKEADVNVSGWNWKGAGPYTITFVAKDTNDVVMAQKSVQIMINQR